MDIELGDELIYGTGICQNCLVRFNEYDEFVTKAEIIQNDIVQLIESKISMLNHPEDEGKIKTESPDDDPIEFEPIDEMYFEAQEVEDCDIQQQENIEFGEEIIDSTEIIQEDYQLEVVVDDSRENHTDLYRHRIKHEYETSPDKSLKNEDGFIIIDIGNNLKAYQCDICAKTFKDKTKLKLHREIHTDQRNVICQVQY